MPIFADFSLTISASTVAWYAAIVATISAIGIGYGVWRDRACLRIEAKPNRKLSQPLLNYPTDRTYIFIEVANTGRRPISLNGWPYFLLKDKRTECKLVIGDWYPKDRLNEGESATMLCFQDCIDLANVRAIAVKDSTGRVWVGKLAK